MMMLARGIQRTLQERVTEQISPKETGKGVESNKNPALERVTLGKQLTETDGLLLAPTSKSIEQLAP